MSTDRDTGAEIRLESLTKLYPGQDRPAVDALDLIIPAGETVAVSYTHLTLPTKA